MEGRNKCQQVDDEMISVSFDHRNDVMQQNLIAYNYRTIVIDQIATFFRKIFSPSIGQDEQKQNKMLQILRAHKTQTKHTRPFLLLINVNMNRDQSITQKRLWSALY